MKNGPYNFPEDKVTPSDVLLCLINNPKPIYIYVKQRKAANFHIGEAETSKCLASDPELILKNLFSVAQQINLNHFSSTLIFQEDIFPSFLCEFVKFPCHVPAQLIPRMNYLMDLSLRRLTSLLQLLSCNQERIINVEQSRV